MQSGWAIGYALAALTCPSRASHDSDGVRSSSSASCRRFSHSGSNVACAEPEIWIARPQSSQARLRHALFASGVARVTIVLTLMNTCTLFAWWGFNLWLPSYLKAPPAQGGIGLGAERGVPSFVVVMQIGMWIGYVTFGFVSDRFGRRRSYVAYLIAAAALLAVYVSVRVPSRVTGARSTCRVCGDRILQRVRRGHRRDLSHRHTGDSAGHYLQRWSAGKRSGTVPGGIAGGTAWVRRGLARLFGGVRAGRACVDLDSGDERRVLA